MLTRAQLKKFLSSDPETGEFRWLIKKSKNTVVGSVAGCVAGSRRCIVIRLCGKLYLAHRLAFLHFAGEFPKYDVDHINGDSSDNRWINLRDVSHMINLQNQRGPRADNTTGFLGVSFNKGMQKYSAKIQINGRLKHIGYFTTAEEASVAYLKSKRALHEGCTI